MKRFVSLLIVIFILVSGIQVYAQGGSIISFTKAERELLQSNSTIQKLRYMTYKAKGQYDDAQKMSDEIGIESIRRILSMFGRKLDPYDEMLLIKQRDYAPAATGYYWEMSQSNKVLTENSMILGLRGMYLAFFSAGSDLKIKKQRLILAEKKYNQDKLRYNLNVISEIDFEESAYNLLKAEKDVKSAARNRENANRKLNSFLGVPVDKSYDIIWFSEGKNCKELMPVGYYLEKAVKDRVDLAMLYKEIELMELEKSILEKNRVNEIYRVARKDYGIIINDIESIKVEIEKKKADIEQEIKDAYIGVKKEALNIENIKKTIEMQERALSKLNTMYEHGMVTDTSIEEMEIAINELENLYKISVYNYNTKLMNLEFNAGAGLASY